jgi:hypothetical protein
VNGTGGAFGAKYVDESFTSYLVSRLGPAALESYRKQEPQDYLEMLAEWERIKCKYNPQTGNKVTYFKIPNKLHRLLDKTFPEVMERLRADQDGDDDRIYLNQATMETIFKPTLDGLFDKVQEELDKMGRLGCDVLYLVGGFSESPLLREQLEQRFKSKVKKIVMPPVPGAAIVEGAVAFGLNPAIIRARRSRLTYGITNAQPFQEGIDPEDKKFWASDLSNFYCNKRFSIYATAGESIGIDQKATSIFTPMERDQKVLSFKFMATTKQWVRYTDEENVVEIGELSMERQDVSKGLDWPIEVNMYFGKTEIKAEALDKTTGKRVETTLRFSFTYHTDLLGV